MANKYIKSIALFIFTIMVISCSPYKRKITLTRNDFAPIKLAYIDFKVKKGASYNNWGKIIGDYQFKYASGCKRVDKKVLLNKERTMKRHMRFFENFFEQLNENYPVVLSKTNPYYIYSDKINEPEYLISAEITDLFLNVCDHYDWKKGEYKNLRSGTSEIKMTWRITDLAKRKIYWKASSVGYGKITDPVVNGERELVEKAFSDSLRRISYLKGFDQILSQRRSKKEIQKDKNELIRIASLHKKQEKKQIEKIKNINGGIIPASSDWWGDGHNGWKGVDGWLGQITIDKVKEFKKMTPAIMYKIRSSVVAVENKDKGVGSGILISPQLILTADSVVNSYSNVKLTTINGRVNTGRPIRRHIKRDVALIYRKPTKFSPLPLRLDLPKVGEEVFFALGAPTEKLGEGFIDDTGVVTGYRYSDGGVEIMVSTYVQENSLGGALIDKKGNIIAIAHSGIRVLPEENDYFIPIADALQKLDVKIKNVKFKKRDIKKNWVPVNQPSMIKPLPSKAKNNDKEYKKAKKKLAPNLENLSY